MLRARSLNLRPPLRDLRLTELTDCVPYCMHGSYRSGKTGKSPGICVVVGTVRENTIFEKSGKMRLNHADCRYLIFCVTIIKKEANLWLPLKIQKLEVFHLKWPLARGSVICILIH